ncbi:MAG: hypothetical protein N4A65_02645 [Cohaesibacter sp.]|nr:hypothetical protein [Cohaesibacter sp.]
MRVSSMIFCVQGRLTEAPKPPQTQPQRRNVMVAVDSDHPAKARETAMALLTEQGYSFITLDRIFEVNETTDPALNQILDEARRHGVGMALYA